MGGAPRIVQQETGEFAVTIQAALDYRCLIGAGLTPQCDQLLDIFRGHPGSVRQPDRAWKASVAPCSFKVNSRFARLL